MRREAGHCISDTKREKNLSRFLQKTERLNDIRRGGVGEGKLIHKTIVNFHL